jgi:transposase InsO family protein
MKYHSNSRTNIFIRKEIARRVQDGEGVTKVAKDFGLSRPTIYKWSRREDFKDLTSRPKKYGYPQCKWKPPKIKPVVIRYEKNTPGEMVHMDTFRVYAGGKRYVGYVAIDSCTRMLCAKILDRKTQSDARHFLDLTRASFSFNIQTILTDNGSEFCGGRKRHLFEMECLEQSIVHKTTRPARPQTNGKAERVIRTLKEGWYRKRKYENLKEAALEMVKFVNWYNNQRSHMSIKMTPLQKLKMVA